MIRDIMNRQTSTATYEWPPVTPGHMRGRKEDAEFTDLLRTFDRTVARIHALGVDIRRLRPDPVRQAAREVLTAYGQFLDIDEGGLEILRDALTELLEALGD
jgi:hypothetical protein